MTASTALLDALSARPEYAEGLARIERAIWSQQALDATILSLCRQRIRDLVGCAPTELSEAVSHWPTDPGRTAVERVRLGHAEQLLIDASAVSDDDAERVIAAVGRDVYLVLTYACGIFETMARAELVLDLPGVRR